MGFCQSRCKRNSNNPFNFLLGLVSCGTAALSFIAFNYNSLQISPIIWLFLQSLSLYTVYLSFQTIFFDRFIACFKIKGNVGFFIITLDFIGYTGTVLVLIFKEFLNPDINWLEFYNFMSGYVGIICCIAFCGSSIYIIQRYKKERLPENKKSISADSTKNDNENVLIIRSQTI